MPDNQNIEPPACIALREWCRNSGEVIYYEEIGNWGIMVTNNGSYYKTQSPSTFMVWCFRADLIRHMNRDELKAFEDQRREIALRSQGTIPSGFTATHCHYVNKEPFPCTAWRKEVKRVRERCSLNPTGKEPTR